MLVTARQVSLVRVASKRLEIKHHFHLSDWLALACCFAVMVLAIPAILLWFQQGMLYSALVGIDSVETSREWHACRADGAFDVFVGMIGVSLVVRWVHLRAIHRVSLFPPVVRCSLEHIAMGIVTWTTFAVLGSPAFVSNLIWTLISRRCGTE